jgi:PleD family two-component response regulator
MKLPTAVSMLAFASLSLAFAPPGARACGEGQFNMGQGLGYQAYLAPNPADVLVMAPGEDRIARRDLYMGLQRAGHRVTLVGDAAQLQEALAARRYDVVIADIDDADALAPAIAANQATRLIPVVPRTARHDPRLRAQYAAFLLDRASLGQYLRAINASVTVAAR